MATPPIPPSAQPQVVTVRNPRNPQEAYVEITNAARVLAVQITVYCNDTLVATQTVTRGTPAMWRSAPLERCPAGEQRIIEPRFTMMTAPDPIAMRDAAQPLEVNLSTEHYCSLRTRAQGEVDLFALVRTADVEDHFQFYADTAPAQQGMWCENGEEETESGIKFLLGAPELQFVSTQLAPHFVSAYHYHPRCADDRPGCDYPSPEDLQSMYDNAMEIAKTTPDVQFDYRVLTRLGLFTFAPTPQLYLARDTAIETMVTNYRDVFVRAAAADVEANAGDGRRPRDESGRAFVSRAGSALFRATFSPMPSDHE